MNKLEQIIRDAKENYKGDIDLAVAAHIYTPGVVAKCGGIVPPFADKQKMAGLKGLVTRHTNKLVAKKAAAEKAAAEKAAAEKPKAKAKAKAKAKPNK